MLAYIAARQIKASHWSIPGKNSFPVIYTMYPRKIAPDMSQVMRFQRLSFISCLLLIRTTARLATANTQIIMIDTATFSPERILCMRAGERVSIVPRVPSE